MLGTVAAGQAATLGLVAAGRSLALLRGRSALGSPSGRETWFVLSNWVLLFATVLIVVLTLFPVLIAPAAVPIVIGPPEELTPPPPSPT